MFAAGSPWTDIMSATLPGSSVPISFPSRNASAVSLLAEAIASHSENPSYFTKARALADELSNAACAIPMSSPVTKRTPRSCMSRAQAR